MSLNQSDKLHKTEHGIEIVITDTCNYLSSIFVDKEEIQARPTKKITVLMAGSYSRGNTVPCSK